jgi:hypothetical protein
LIYPGTEFAYLHLPTIDSRKQARNLAQLPAQSIRHDIQIFAQSMPEFPGFDKTDFCTQVDPPPSPLYKSLSMNVPFLPKGPISF